MDEYIVVKALENGVNIIGLTSGKDTKFHHTEKLDKGEVFLAQFTDVTTAIKINGAAEIYTKHGKLCQMRDKVCHIGRRFILCGQ